MANGLDEKRLAAQIDEIEELNSNLEDITILKSIEVDILSDGKLDLPRSILKSLDIVVCSVHYNQKLSKKKQTDRIIKAMDNPYFNILAHPTGRLLGERKAYEADMERIMKAAKAKNCYLEINAHPDRIDLNDSNILMAKQMGLKLVISTDAHSIQHFNYMKYGIAQARRGWLEKDDILNTFPLNNLMKMIKR